MSTDAIKVQEKTQKEWKNGKLWNALFWSSSARDRHPDVLRRGRALYFRVRASFSLWVWGFRKAP